MLTLGPKTISQYNHMLPNYTIHNILGLSVMQTNCHRQAVYTAVLYFLAINYTGIRCSLTFQGNFGCSIEFCFANN